jgi:hypothetical protein
VVNRLGHVSFCGPPRARDVDLRAQVDVTGEGWQNCGAYRGGANRSAHQHGSISGRPATGAQFKSSRPDSFANSNPAAGCGSGWRRHMNFRGAARRRGFVTHVPAPADSRRSGGASAWGNPRWGVGGKPAFEGRKGTPFPPPPIPFADARGEQNAHSAGSPSPGGIFRFHHFGGGASGWRAWAARSSSRVRG